jgi:ribosomal protein S10
VKYRLKITVKGYNNYNVESVLVKIISMISSMEEKYKITKSVPLPNKIHKRAILRSPFKHKNHFEHFGRIVHRRIFYVLDSGMKSDSNMKLLKRLNYFQLPSSVKLEIEQIEHESVN